MSELSGRPSTLYEGASIREVLQAALLGTENLVRRAGVTSDEVEAWIDHLWAWVSLDGEAFNAWYEGRPALTDVGRGRGLPGEVATAFLAGGVRPADAEALVTAVTDIIYGNILAAITWSWVGESIDRVGDVLERYELGLPPPSLIGASGRDESLGWGAVISSETANAHRVIPWNGQRSD